MGELFGGDVGLAGKENFVGRSGAVGFFGLGLDILTKDFFNFYKKIYLNFFWWSKIFDRISILEFCYFFLEICYKNIFRTAKKK